METDPATAWRMANPCPKSFEAICQWVCDGARFRLTNDNEPDVDQIIEDITLSALGVLSHKEVDALVRSLPDCTRANQNAIREQANREATIENIIRKNRGGNGREV